jgi:probable HAF family extracellular repeat protein
MFAATETGQLLGESMRTKGRTRALGGSVFFSMYLLTTDALAELPAYRVQDLGTLGGRVTHAADLNEVGQVTGYSERADGQLRAFLYTNGKMKDLGTLGGTGSLANALNDLGHVTGFSVTADGRTRAFLYAAGRMIDLGAPDGDSIGSDISNLGHIAGFATGTDGRNRAFSYSLGMTSHLGLPARVDSFAAAVNDLGQVAGTIRDEAGSHVFFYSQGVRRDLFPGRVSSIFGSQALNDAGQVTGSVEQPGVTRAFLFGNGRTVYLGGLGGNFSYGLGLNEIGDVTGVSATAQGLRHAFVYSAGAMTDLGTLGGTSSIGYAINFRKQVAGEATLATGTFHAFVHTGGRMVDIGREVEARVGVGSLESVAYDINDAGQVIGRYYRPDPADPTRVNVRAFVATPVVSLIDALLARVVGVGPGKSLADKVGRIRMFYGAQNKRFTCSTLQDFRQQLAAQAGKKLTRAKAESLRSDALVIAESLNC